MARREREALEHAVRVVSEQAVKADELVDDAKAAGGGDHPVTVHAKMLRLELLEVKADLELGLEDLVLNCRGDRFTRDETPRTSSAKGTARLE